MKMDLKIVIFLIVYLFLDRVLSANLNSTDIIYIKCCIVKNYEVPSNVNISIVVFYLEEDQIRAEIPIEDYEYVAYNHSQENINNLYNYNNKIFNDTEPDYYRNENNYQQNFNVYDYLYNPDENNYQQNFTEYEYDYRDNPDENDYRPYSDETNYKHNISDYRIEIALKYGIKVKHGFESSKDADISRLELVGRQKYQPLTYIVHNFDNIKMFELRNLNLQLFDEDFFMGYRVENLHFNSNLLQILKNHTFKHLENTLENLDLSRNRILEIGEFAFDGLSYVKKLFLNGNEIKELHPNLFKSLSSLQELFIKNNQIEYLDDDLFRNLEDLQKLHMESNLIEVISSTIFSKTSNLKHLSMEQNQIKIIYAEAFDSLSSLNYLSLAFNQISSINDTLFFNLASLKTLDLESNKIRYISEKLFSQNTKLSKLYIKSNEISEVEKGAKIYLDRIDNLQLSDNLCIDEDLKFTNALNNSFLLEKSLYPFCEVKEIIEEEKNYLIIYVAIVGVVVILIACCIGSSILCRRKLNQSRRQKMFDLFSEWCDITTIHGIRYFGTKDISHPARFLWLMIFLLSVGLSSWKIHETYIKWRENPVVIGFENVPIGIWEVPFPAITICPEYKVREGFEAEYNIMSINNIFSYRNVAKALSQICPLIASVTKLSDDGYVHKDNPEDYIPIMRNISVSITERIESYEWKKKKPEDKYLTETATDIGICLSFNLLSEDEIFNIDEVDPKFITEISKKNFDQKSFGWDLEKGYTDKTQFRTYPLRSINSKTDMGFKMTLNLSNKSSDIVCNNFVGYKVALHFPGDWPQLKSQYIDVSFERKTTIIVKPQVVMNSDTLVDYKPHERKCYYPSERNLQFFKIYTKANCELECLTNFTFNTCGCVTFAMPRTNETKVCKHIDLRCSEIAAKNAHLIKFSILKTSGKDEYKDCNCFPACYSINYDFDISQSSIKGNKSIALEMYMKEDTFIGLVRSELHGLIDFMANMGGLLGLFTGVSIISIIEIIYYFCRGMKILKTPLAPKPDETESKLQSSKSSNSSIQNIEKNLA